MPKGAAVRQKGGAVRPARGPSRAGEGRRTVRAIPPMDAVLARQDVAPAVTRHGRPLVAALLRERLAALRRLVIGGSLQEADLEREVRDLGAWVDGEARVRTASSLRPVINGTGVVLHTNLGRAPLSEAASRHVVEVARSYTTLEYDLARGRRGSRSSHLDRLLTLIFPGRAAHVVNNNAAAVLLALNTLGEGKEVVVSRGELVEIGGSFRIPDIMRKSGAILREVGTTNKTRLADYARALGPGTGLLLKVHPSNYRIVGFTAQVPLSEVVALGRRRRVPVLMDQGSGNLLDLVRHGIRGEPSVHDALATGADVVCFSGDKILGGPQAGFLVGRPDLIKRMRDNPLSRALRVDKMTFAALEASLLEYARGRAEDHLPVARMIAATREAIERRARRLVEIIAARAGGGLSLSIVPGLSLLGGGSAPEEGLPTVLIAVGSPGLSARAVEERLRRSDPPLIARIEGGKVLVDLRTVLEEQDALVGEAIAGLAAGV
ncbi:MAG TPA: L-seryl-tRNA(Sec) selenium transferase [Candidatus Polarisedimenticolia bacterium]|nr:L-seryl-tRNA(Sec) selenium transferase [Candidatus Polarisedimenticolia bacterium]